MIKNYSLESELDVINIYKGQRKNLFSTLRHMYKSSMYHLKPIIALERFCIVTHSYAASVSIKTHFYEANIIF